MIAVWQDTCQTYKNLVYDLANHESPIAQWLERPTGIWKVMGSTSVGGSENSFSEYFNLRTFLHYSHYIQVTNPFIKLYKVEQNVVIYQCRFDHQVCLITLIIFL